MTDPATFAGRASPGVAPLAGRGEAPVAGQPLDLLVGVPSATLPAVLLVLLVVVLAGAAVAVARRLARRTDGEETATAAGPSPPAVAELDDDEQFVVDLLRANDGRVHQSKIVDAADWSKSKVSRLLSRMERDGHVEKITVGRRNLVVLARSEPDD